ncbi:M99 family carboxypeptidase catalytic domain-containing protein [Halorubellus litoreus]|uniref:Succinylglutamate desuccinylase/aspartoacylase family protein n=1 Tax=Halorubellus litoreus TaxID=755308 RepID=A0ABD5VIK0_9EURY
MALGAGAVALGQGTGDAAASSGASRSSHTIMSGTYMETTVHEYDSGVAGPTTLVVGGIHGDERSGYEAAETISDWSVKSGRLVVLPRANVDAIARDVRPYDNDLNRDFPPTGGDCYSSLARGIWQTVEQVDPDWVFDLHSSRGIYKSGDGGVGQALFPTWTSPSRENGENAVAYLNDAFGLTGDMAYRMGNTLDADRDMLMHRVAGMLDRPGFICETTEKAPLEDQIQWHLATVEHVMGQYGQYRGEPTQSKTPSSAKYVARTATLDDYWKTFDFGEYYGNPVVVAPSVSYVGTDPAHPRLSNLTNRSVDVRVEEWNYLNDVHYQESAGVLAFEDDANLVGDDGGRIQAGRQHVGSAWEEVSFDDSFDSAPIVLASPMSDYSGIPVISRIRRITRDGFQILNQEEDASTAFEDQEMTGWVAIEPGTGSLGGRRYEAGRVTMDDAMRSIDFSRSYDDPVFLASPTTYNGWNTVTVRHSNLSSTGVDAFLQEEQSADWEQSHTAEKVSYVVFEG